MAYHVYMADDVQRIKDKLPIVDVISQYVKLERSGANFRARCPFHAERTPSFFVSPERGTYHCFGCNAGGDILSFVQEIEGLDFKGALKVLAEKAGITLEYSRAGKNEKNEVDRLYELMEAATIYYAGQLSDAAKKYMHERGISDATIHEFRLGLSGDGWSDLIDHLKAKKYSEKEILEAGVAARGERGIRDKFRNRILFPIADSAGRIVGFSGRIFGENASQDAPKYLNSPETPLFHKSRILYGLDKAKLSMRKHNCAVLVEGQIDLLASHQAGWSNTVAVSGTAFTHEHATLIRRFTDNLVIALDADEAGIKAAGRAARAALQAGLNVKVARLPNGLDPADLILSAASPSASRKKQGSDAWNSAIRDAKEIVTFLLDVLEERSKGRDWLHRHVEAIVLPYVADVQSPIARERYQREIAERLGVSENAVAEALERLPKVPERTLQSEQPQVVASAEKKDRAKIAYAILLYQRSLPKPDLDLESYERELREAVGDDAWKGLQTLSAAEEENLRFDAERLYAGNRSLHAEAKALLTAHLRDRLARELAEASAALKKAEMSGREEEVAVYMSVCNVLTKRIARLHEVL